MKKVEVDDNNAFEVVKRLIGVEIESFGGVQKETRKMESQEPEIEDRSMRDGSDLVDSNKEKVAIAMEVLAEMKSKYVAYFPEIRDIMFIFVIGTRKGLTKKNNIVYLGYDMSRREMYQFYAQQILDIMVLRFPSLKEMCRNDNRNDINVELGGKTEEDIVEEEGIRNVSKREKENSVAAQEHMEEQGKESKRQEPISNGIKRRKKRIRKQRKDKKKQEAEKVKKKREKQEIEKKYKDTQINDYMKNVYHNIGQNSEEKRELV